MIKLTKICKKYFINEGEKSNFSFWNSLRNNNKSYNHIEIDALKNISTDFRMKEIIGIVGNNGAGKTTLLQILAGVVKPTKGSLNIEGKIDAVLSLETQFNGDLTGRENAHHHFRIKGFNDIETVKYANEAIVFAGLGKHIDRLYRTYSTGMKARLAFSCVTSIYPEILLIDETLSVGDAEFSQKGFMRLRRLIELGKLVIIVSHDLDAIRMLCTRVVWIDKGKIRSDGDTNIVVNEYLNGMKECKEIFKRKRNDDEKYIEERENANFYFEDVNFRTNGDILQSNRMDSFSNLQIQYKYFVNESIDDIEMEINLERMDGFLVLKRNVKHDNMDTINIAKKMKTVRIDLGRLILNCGEYVVRLNARNNIGKIIGKFESKIEINNTTNDSDQPLIYLN